MKKKQFLLLGLVVGLISAYVIWSTFLKTAPSTTSLDTEAEITANELYQAFYSDETEANKLYLNKIIEVSGVVTSIDESEDLKPSISLATEGFGVIKCTFETAEDFDPKSVSVGAQITIKGECIGYLLDVLIRNSIIITD